MFKMAFIYIFISLISVDILHHVLCIAIPVDGDALGIQNFCGGGREGDRSRESIDIHSVLHPPRRNLK
jgi:hypothetical protein